MSKRRPILQPIDRPPGSWQELVPARDPEIRITLRRIPATERHMQRPFIPVSEPDLNGRELEYLRNCVETGWISSAGRYIEDFEKTFAARCGAEHGVACTSGTTALHLALATLGIGPGDEVILPTFTMIATPNAVRYLGATPVLVDSEGVTWNMDLQAVEVAITDRTIAIVAVHTYGHPVDMDRLNAIAAEHGLWVVEDAAEAHGAEYKDRLVGSLADAACFSFYANKIITTGEGGMITTNDADLAATARRLRDHAFSDERHFWHRFVGFNYRMTNLQAAVGLAQVERWDELVQRRIDHARRYSELLAEVEGLKLPPESEDVRNVFWMYGLLILDSFGVSRDELRRSLANNGIETRTFFIPVHLQPIYYRDYEDRSFPVAEELGRRGLYLPSGAMLSNEDIEYVAHTIKACQQELGSA